ncbi:MAG: type II secretion system F family protein [Betaproteobacteria bacterium]|jgi:type IV pilus assembly protein PilC|nr:type II secretion system F family protein [Betaproteobacteria bacterium]MBK7082445.1 type II secretion system F family protein [Betaproteobacteria bacterium]MBK7593577.1 type II secretion system F family protein [Betaproteobacteria bacterium]MBK7744288.1 type II secretion system F family protein [Betaproteobacteria bacterium]MBK9702676.1 type II secretion system F family protein [Betaproteobacteria bacterium]
MATATTTASRRDVKEYTYLWEGTDRNSRQLRGEVKAASETVVITNLRRQGVRVTKIKRQTFRGGRKVSEKDVTFFTRQLATMLKSGVPLLQSFEIVARGHSNARFSRLMMDIKSKVESGSSLSQAFRQYPDQFDSLYCNLVNAGETAGMLDAILERLATYKEKILAIKAKIKSALFYPMSVIVVAIVVVWVIMIFVIPAFKEVFSSFGADLPAPTMMVIELSDFMVRYWWVAFLAVVGASVGFGMALKRSAAVRYSFDRLILKVPVIGSILEKATIARWTRTLATMFAAGVPLVESLDAVAGAAGNTVYAAGTKRIQTEVSTGTSLTNAMTNTNLFPNMVLQMTQIGEESGSLDGMLSKVADFFEREVDDAVATLSSLLEPIIIVFLGVVIGGLVVAMYLPIFKLGTVV